MKLRTKNLNCPKTCYSSSFNSSALAEVLVNFEDGDADSVFIWDLEVELESGWKDFSQAFKDKDIITDNYNRSFFIPPTKEDKERGYTLSRNYLKK